MLASFCPSFRLARDRAKWLWILILVTCLIGCGERHDLKIALAELKATILLNPPLTRQISEKTATLSARYDIAKKSLSSTQSASMEDVFNRLSAFTRFHNRV